MKAFFVDDNHYTVFINNIELNIDFNNKNDVEKLLKKTIKWMIQKYNISVLGLYEVNIYVNNKVGIFIEFEKISSIISCKDVDLKINIIYNCDFYFKTEYFECVENFENLYFRDGYYFVNVISLDVVDKYIEFGDIIYLNDLNFNMDFIKIK